MSFLTAEWRKLAIFNYEVSPQILEQYLPYKTELDLWEGKCYVSIIGFVFLNTKVLGIKVPFHINFEELNLRFYVKYFDGKEWKRGASFIKEIVPKKLITLIANTMYSEKYVTSPMQQLIAVNNEGLEVEYQWQYKNEWQSVNIVATNECSSFEKNSIEEFITEHYWGYTKVTDTKTYEYGVTHPQWQMYPVKSYETIIDFSQYGNEFSFLNNVKPNSVILAEGSLITIEGKKTIQ